MIGALSLVLLILATFGIGVVGSLAGLVLGNLRLPLLLGFLAPAVAGGTNVTVSGAGAAAGVMTHLRGGRFDRQVFAIMAPPSVVGAVLGGFLSGLVPGTLLVLVVVIVVLEQGLELIWSDSRPAPTGLPRAEVPRNARWAALLAAAGFGIGILGALIGLILGTVRLPAMLRAGVNVRDAIATNLAVGAVVGLAALVGHLLGGTIDLLLAGLLVPAAVAGSVVGARLTGELSERSLRKVVGGVLVGVGTILLLFLVLGMRLP